MTQLETVYKDNIKPSESIAFEINQGLGRLQKVSDRMSVCRVVLSSPHHHIQKRSFNVQIFASLPGADLIAHRSTEDYGRPRSLKYILRDTFHIMHRQLIDHKQLKAKPRTA